MRSFFSNIRPALLAEFGGASPTAFQSALAGMFESRIAELFLDLASRDLHHAHGVADYVGGALLALRSFRHGRIIAQSDRERTDF